MTARFWSWPASEPAKSRTLTAAVAPRIVEASMGCKLEPRNFPVRPISALPDRIEVYDLPAAPKGIVGVQVDIAPRRR